MLGHPSEEAKRRLGKTWGWEDPKTVTYLGKEGMTDEKWKTGKVLWTLPSDEDKSK